MIRELFLIEKMMETLPRYRVEGSNAVFTVGDREVNIRQVPSSSVRRSIDRCVVQNQRVVCSGWAFSTNSMEPVKRVLIAHGGIVLGAGKLRERTDVRRKLELVYDQSGYGFDIEIPGKAYDADNFQLLFFHRDSVSQVDRKCVSDVKPLIDGTSFVHIGDHHFSFASDEEQSVEGSPGALVFASGKFRFKIETMKFAKGKFRCSGWCVNPQNPSARLVLGLARGKRIISGPRAANVIRTDVVDRLAITTSTSFYGFSIEVDADLVEGLELDELQLFAVDELEGVFTASSIPVTPPARETSQAQG